MMELFIFIICFFIAEDLQASKSKEPLDKDLKLDNPKHKAWLARRDERKNQREIEEFRQTIRDFENSWSQ